MGDTRLGSSRDGKADMGEVRRLEARAGAAERRFDQLIDEAPIGMAVVDLDTRMTRVNQALCSFLGYPASELVGLRTLDVTHPDDVDADLEYGVQRRTDDPTVSAIEKRFIRRDGAIVWGLLKVSVVRGEDGRPLYMLGYVVDITDRVLREQALAERAAHDREVTEELRTLDEAKNTFLSAVSHELRAPLTAVRGFAELLQHRDRTLTSTQRERYLERLTENAARLGQLLEDLLDVDRMIRGQHVRPDRAPTDLADLVERAVANLEEAGTRVELELSPVDLSIGRTEVERIVQNLVANALRYTPETAPVTVRLADHDGGALLSVADRGPGVADEHKLRIFEPFERSGADRGPVPGTGLGLALVARFAQMHDGRAWVEDRPGGGAVFKVWLSDG